MIELLVEPQPDLLRGTRLKLYFALRSLNSLTSGGSKQLHHEDTLRSILNVKFILQASRPS